MPPAKMTPKERALTAFHHEAPDRVPIDYLTNPNIDRSLKAHFGLRAGDDEGLLQALQVDFRKVEAPYVGPDLYDPPPGKVVNPWGAPRVWVEHETGGYWDYEDFPLQHAGLEEVEAWPMPSPDDYDYAAVAEQCRRYEGYFIIAGATNVGDIINQTSMIRNMEQVLIDLLSGDPACLRWIDRRLEIQHEIIARTLEAGRGCIDMLWMGEDLGSQNGPLISPRLFRKQIRPRLQRFVDLAKDFGLLTMFHSCGSSSWAFEDFIEMGIDVIDTLQPEAANMDPFELKAKYGGRLAFHGGITTGGPVAFGTVEETVAHARRVLDAMMPGGGYAFSPSHQFQDNSKTENVVALYHTARTYGRYSREEAGAA